MTSAAYQPLRQRMPDGNFLAPVRVLSKLFRRRAAHVFLSSRLVDPTMTANGMVRPRSCLTSE